ncbi:MAG: 4Fe-4S binding protein [Actinomycetota bacterium]
MSASRGRSRKSFDRFLRLYRYKDLVFRMTNWPVIRQLGGPIIDYRNTNLTYVPIYQEMELPAGTAAPLSVIEHFIREAAHHVILHRCPCRSENGCRDFDPYFGCTFLGPAARDVDPEVGRHVSAEEALEHLYRATEMGLVSCLGKFRGDAIMLGVRDHHRLMTICHCCPCCCISTAIPLASRRARDLLVRMEGLVVEVDPDRCQGCGKCVEACIFRQVRLVEREPAGDSRAAAGPATSAAQGVVATGEGSSAPSKGSSKRVSRMAVIGEECKGCGRCAMVCPEKAVRIRIENPSYIEACVRRISSSVEVR